MDIQSKTAIRGNALFLIARIIEYALQPFLIVTVLLVWFYNQNSAFVYPLIVLGIQLVLGLTEHKLPARSDWVPAAKQKFGLVILVFCIFVYSATIAAPIYNETLNPLLSGLREQLGLDIWPTSWPILGQVLMAFFLSELIWYWLHRAEHRWSAVWRISGHGAHHAFKKLNAINFGANHPMEYFVLLIPGAVVELLFGAGLAVAGAAVLVVTQASIAHSNIKMNSRGIGLLFTTNRFHIHHHSMILEESNTNYGCAAIIWDRIFATFQDEPTLETGIGPTEPSTWKKFLMPVKEPEDIQIAPS